jgi:hypothetical protein
MDPNKIHIDELVRQRLQGGEEEPRPGAWIGMRELLDKQMPVGTRPLGGFAWGRAARWTTALLLLTVVAGGYGAFEIRRSVHEGVANTNVSTSPSSPTKSSGSARSRHNSDFKTNPVSSDAPAIVRSNSADIAAPAVGAKSGSSSSRTAVSASAGTLSAVQHDNSSLHTDVSKRSKAIVEGNIAAVSAPAKTNPGEDGVTTNARTSKNSDRRSSNKAPIASTRNTTRVAAPAEQALKVQSEKTSRVQNRAARKAASSRRPTTTTSTSTEVASVPSNPSDNSGQNLSSASRAESGSGVKNTATTRAQRRRGKGIISDSANAQVQLDTLRPIRVAHRYMSTRGIRGGGRYMVDTLASEPIIIERPIPVIASTQQVTPPARQRRPLFNRKRSSSATTATPVVAAAAPVQSPVKAASSNATSADPNSPKLVTPAASQPMLAAAVPAMAANVEMVPLSSKKVSSTTNSKLKYTAQEQIQDVMRRTEFLFGQMRLYSGVNGGFNASVAGTSMGGFHAGLFGLLAINDHWSIGLEGKFVQRFNRGTELHDPYFHYRASTFNNFTDPAGQAYKVYRVTTDSFENYYKLSTLESVEFPVYARYSFRRFHAFGGANVTYGLRVKNIHQVDRFAGRESAGMDTVLASVQYAPPANTAASVKLEDFGPRFGLGYTAGVGYQASPAVLVDVRMTQLVWDNRSSGAGGLRVSQTYYRMPSLQLSIGYRFSQRMGHR